MSSLIAHQQRSAVQWPIFKIPAPFVVFGRIVRAYITARLFHDLPTKKLRHLFAIFLLLIGLTMLDV